MLYEIIKCTAIDSMHEKREHYLTIDADVPTLETIVIPKLNHLVHISNKNVDIIHSNKKIHFRIKPVNGLSIMDIVATINYQIEDEIAKYNSFVHIANRQTIRMNKLNGKPEGIGVLDEFNSNDFNNPFVNYRGFAIEATTLEYLAEGIFKG